LVFFSKISKYVDFELILYYLIIDLKFRAISTFGDKIYLINIGILLLFGFVNEVAF